MTIDFYDLINNQVWSQSKRDNLIAIFENEDPGHYEKLYFCGFLLNVLKLSTDSILEIILEQSNWNKKDPHMTFLQVRSVVKSISQFSVSEAFLNRFRSFENNETNETKPNITNTVKKYASSEKANKPLSAYEPVDCYLRGIELYTVHVLCYFKKCEQCKNYVHSSRMNKQEQEVKK